MRSPINRGISLPYLLHPPCIRDAKYENSVLLSPRHGWLAALTALSWQKLLPPATPPSPSTPRACCPVAVAFRVPLLVCVCSTTRGYRYSAPFQPIYPPHPSSELRHRARPGQPDSPPPVFHPRSALFPLSNTSPARFGFSPFCTGKYTHRRRFAHFPPSIRFSWVHRCPSLVSCILIHGWLHHDVVPLRCPRRSIRDTDRDHHPNYSPAIIAFPRPARALQATVPGLHSGA